MKPNLFRSVRLSAAALFVRSILSILPILALLLTSCAEVTQPPPPEIDTTSTPEAELTPIDLTVGYGVRGSWFELYFTDPTNPLSPQGTGGVDGPLVEAIDNARLSIDVAAYSLSLNSVRFALINAHKRGVTVRMVMESENMDRSDPQALIEAGIPIVGDNQNGLMHDKFMVIDRSEVWLGSMNFTDTGAYDDHNHMIRVLSTKMAENYTVEFEEMFKEDLFGEKTRPATPHPELTLDGIEVKTYFSPDDGVLGALAPLLNSAEQSIYFLAFSFTSNDLGAIVRAQDKAGLIVRGVMEAEQVRSNQGTEYDPFKQAGLEVRLDGLEGQMHHKVFIIDEKIVVLGSYNFSQAAEVRNDENVLIIYNPAIAEQFMLEFERIWARAIVTRRPVRGALMSHTLKLLAVFPHPDDETMGLGSTLARYSAEGVETYLVCATRGERGWFESEGPNPGLAGVAHIREAELRCAAESLGLREVSLLDYLDGDVDQADPTGIIGRLVTHLRRIRPQVVVTFAPDGAYGHPDHIALSQFTNAALVCAADADYADDQAPHRVSKFYYMIDSMDIVQLANEAFGGISMEVDGVTRRHVGWEDWQITTRLDNRQYLDWVKNAIRCHKSQLPGYGPIAEWSLDELSKVFGVGNFYRAFSLVNGGRQVETDLFEGLR